MIPGVLPHNTCPFQDYFGNVKLYNILIDQDSRQRARHGMLTTPADKFK
ncbi:hypothetical protein AVEN_220416-1, partial [Araneus ventricosus]